ncbi:MAG: aldo/keto reductase [Phycisphaerae bacterium]
MDHLNPHPDLYNVPFSTDKFNEMPYRQLGSSGLRASAVGLGAWKFGFPETGDQSRVNEKDSLAILDRAVKLGVTFWDTANRYNNASGNSERIIGRWFSANPDQRRNIVLATKVCGGMDGRTPNHGGLSRGCVLDSVYACLARLQTPYIDLLYFHRFDDLVPIEESLTAVEDLVRRDLVRYLGVSNFSVEQLEAYKAVGERMGTRCRIVAVQNRYDMLYGETAAHRGALAWCAANGASLVAWGPLRQGLLTGRYLDPAKAGRGDRLFDEGALAKEATPEVIAKVRALDALARGWGMELSQLALAYMLAQPGMGPVIPSASSPAQVESNARAATACLSAQQLAQVSDAIKGK